MPKKSDGSGTIYLRGDIWWVKIRVDGRPVYESSGSTKRADAIKHRDKMLAKKHRGELSGGAPDKVLIDELLNDVLKSDVKPSTLYIWKKVVEKSIRPFFGKIKARRLSTDHMDDYRAKRKSQGVVDSTVNRELAVLRIAFNNARKRTPPKVYIVPYFPTVKETTIRQGFLADAQYAALRDALPLELKALFVTGYITGMRLGEILMIRWDQVDFEAGSITLDKGETKNDDARSVPITEGDMRELLMAAKAQGPGSTWVFNRRGVRIKSFRGAWIEACKRAGVPTLTFHDLRRTAVRNMRRAGIPQVVRMKISGHKTDSMERRNSIVDAQDLSIAKELLENRIRVSDIVTTNVTISGQSRGSGETRE
jgi:integrase